MQSVWGYTAAIDTGRCRCTCAVCAEKTRTIRVRRGASRPSGTSATASSPMPPFAFTLALCWAPARRRSALRLLPTPPPARRPRPAGPLPLIAVVAWLIMFDTRRRALTDRRRGVGPAPARALLVSRSISPAAACLESHALARRLRPARRLSERVARGGHVVVTEMSAAPTAPAGQRELVAAASHLRTPLTNLRAAAEALEDGVGSRPHRCGGPGRAHGTASSRSARPLALRCGRRAADGGDRVEPLDDCLALYG
jgi:signal transduction histidine kinase